MPNLKNGTTLGGWKLGRFRGGGGQGEVWEVRAEGVPHTPPRAMKVCTSTDDVARKRFEREVELLAELEHRGLSRVIERDLSWTHEPRSGLSCSYFVTELFAGSLSDHAWIHRAPMLALELFREVLDAVVYLHSREPQVLHRDLKPDNILVGGEPWRAVLIDLGIATQPFDNAEERLTHAREVVGTLVYRAPEVAMGHPHTEKSDVYSLGRTLEWLLSGREPTGVEPSVAFDEALYSQALRAELAAVLRKACAYDPQQRYGSAAEFRTALPVVTMTASRAAAAAPSSLATPVDEYERVKGIISSRDAIAWREMEKDSRKQVPQVLLEWRGVHERDRPSQEAQLHAWMDDLIVRGQSYIVRAAASGEFATHLPGPPIPMLDLLWQVPGWNGNGLSVLVEFPRALAYVVQYIVGAALVSAGNARGAAEHAMRQVPRNRERDPIELWRQHDLVGAPQGLGGNTDSAWKYLMALPDRHHWLEQVFGDPLTFRRSLVGYVWILCLLDWCSKVRAPSGEPVENLRPEVPPLCVLAADELIVPGFNLAFRSKHDVDSVCAFAGAAPENVRRGWQDWLQVVIKYAASFAENRFWEARFKPKPELP